MLCSQRTERWNGESSRQLSGGHHIPAGIMDRKLNEFLALTQGNRTVLQYAQAFNDLCQYAGYHADMDEKKRDRFRRGLSTKLRDHFVGFTHAAGVGFGRKAILQSDDFIQTADLHLFRHIIR